MSANRILIIDGSAVSRRIASRVLEEAIEGVEVTVCGAGMEARELIDREDEFDLIASSQMLPDMDGLELCRAVRKSGNNRYTPFVIISSDVDMRVMRDGYAAGVTDYFDKSVGYKAFGDFIKLYCQISTGTVGSVMYVEDSLTAATMTKRTLMRHGIEITHFTNVEDALVHLEGVVRGDEGPIDMIITDYYLENALTGGDLLDRVRRHYHITREALPVIVMTSKDDAKLKVDLLHMGANDLLNKPLQEEIMMARIRTLLHLKQQYDALLLQNRAIERVAQTDALTGVYNRRYLAERGREWLKNDKNQPLWALVIDVDNLSLINGNQGLLVGDHILASIGNLLNEHFSNSLVARFGGEEFAVLLPHTPWESASASIDSLRRKVEALSPDGIKVTVSIGVAGAKGVADANLNKIISMADKALGEAKARGRNRTCYIDSSNQVCDLDIGQTPA